MPLGHHVPSQPPALASWGLVSLRLCVSLSRWLTLCLCFSPPSDLSLPFPKNRREGAGPELFSPVGSWAQDDTNYPALSPLALWLGGPEAGAQEA